MGSDKDKADPNSENQSSFRVKDNRRFDSSGNERGEAPNTATPQENGKSAASTPSNAGASSSSEIDFSSFIVSLGTQALMQLGVVKPPDGIAMPVDKASAKQTIDIISMLSERVKGNLTEDEEKLVTEVLHSLRISYVKAV